MGTQIYVKREDMEAAGWEHNAYADVYESEGMNGEVETFTENVCYFTSVKHPLICLWSYDSNDFCADYNAWGSNKPKLDSLGISNLPHHLG